MVQILIAFQYHTRPKCKASCDMHFCDYNAHINHYECCNCFPASAKVSLENGKSVTMSGLQIGDAVKSGELTFIIE